MIKAIETVFKGYRFRSRLEARWAVAFDRLGIKYEYECEGFEVSTQWDNGHTWFYLPDFYLPETKTWVEVKGDLDTVDWDMVPWLVDFGGALPGMENSWKSTQGLLWLGNIPGQRQAALTPRFTILQHSKAGYINSASHFNTICDKPLYDAFQAARQARFEHGQTPKR